ncbi:hypothetical protein Kintu_gp29c [Xanthomonas phage Kintu]
MNLSERIRSCLSSPKTAADVHSEIGGNLVLTRGCIQTMVKVGLLERIGDAKPYRYQVARPLKQKLRGVEKTMAVSQSQQVRDWLKANGPAKNAEVSKGTGFPPKQCSRILSYMKRYGCVRQDDERKYHFVRDAIQMQAMTAEEKREANARNNRTMRARIKAIQQQEIANSKKPDAMTIKIKRQVVVDDRPKQSVEDWLKSGGKIDRSPTEHKFERLTKADIESAAVRGFGGYQTPYSRRFSTIG